MDPRVDRALSRLKELQGTNPLYKKLYAGYIVLAILLAFSLMLTNEQKERYLASSKPSLNLDFFGDDAKQSIDDFFFIPSIAPRIYSYRRKFAFFAPALNS